MCHNCHIVLTSRELKTLYLSDPNNQKIQNNGCQYYQINEKYKRCYWYSFEIPIGVSLHEYPAIGVVANLEKILISLESCIDTPRTPVEDCCHLSVKICTRRRKGKKVYVQGMIRLPLVTYIPTIHKIMCSTEVPN
jgi:hypothetical protein